MAVVILENRKSGLGSGAEGRGLEERRGGMNER